jgi:CubicO group peptidase (beta-lactamase class C family)
MGPDTHVWIASMTKAVTAAAAMQLVERGVLALDAPAAEVEPWLGEVLVLDGFDDDGAARLRPPQRPITLRHLLTHTSGFGYEFADAALARWSAARDAPMGSRAAFQVPLLFDPGDRWSYGVGIDWVGAIVEAATGRRLDVHLREALLEPLGMHDTGFRRTPEQAERAAVVHLRTPDGLVPIPFELPDEPEMLMGGGGLYSTVLDYLRFTRMLLGGGTLEGRQVLAPETVALMARDHLGELQVTGWRTANPMLSNDVDFYPGMRQGWGLSFLVNAERTPEGRSPGSLAWAGLANSYYWVDPAAGVTGVFATQVLPFFDATALGVFRDVERAVYESLT